MNNNSLLYVEKISERFAEHRHTQIAKKKEAYMKNNFIFYGIPTPLRKELTCSFLKKNTLGAKKNLEAKIRELWNKPEREYHYFALDLLQKYSKEYEEKDIELFEFLILHHSWWDSIDVIAPNIINPYFKLFPHQRDRYIDKWLNSQNIWLHRTAVLFQLKNKEALDTELLSMIITRLVGSKEFFINKSIGWILREYGKTNPLWVKKFIEQTDLAPLSKREGLRLLK